jgi:hypothetical protein
MAFPSVETLSDETFLGVYVVRYSKTQEERCKVYPQMKHRNISGRIQRLKRKDARFVHR